MDKVYIVGTGGSLDQFQGTDCPIWAVGSAYNKLEADLYFCMHSFDDLPKNLNVVYQKDYPLDEIVGLFGSSFFTNTISYMIAYAIFKGVKIVEMYGVDMDALSEYEHQKASVNYWIGYARGLGIIMNIHSDIDKVDFLYGFEPTKKLIDAMRNKLIICENKCKLAKSDAEKNQWLGAIYDLKYWERRLKQ